MKKLLTIAVIAIAAFSLVFSGCDMVKGLFGAKPPQGQAPQTGPGQPGGPTVAPPQSPELTAASVNGKYYNLLYTLYVPQDQGSYGNFYDWGYYSGTSYAGYNNLPAGFWVYVYPNWYIWGNTR